VSFRFAVGVVLLLAGSSPAVAQSAPSATPPADAVYTYVEHMPQPVGGFPKLNKYLADSTRYPAKAVQQQLAGNVFINFVVATTGQPTEVKVTKGVHPLLDAEAVRAISRMPAWTPGRQSGRLVNVSYTVPVQFALPEFPGGSEKLKRYLGRELRYPGSALRDNLQGTVMVTYTVDTGGQVTNPQVTTSVRSDVDQEALRLVNNMPRWKPAMINNQPVPVEYSSPVTFRIK
jgi:TonB family protein